MHHSCITCGTHLINNSVKGQIRAWADPSVTPCHAGALREFDAADAMVFASGHLGFVGERIPFAGSYLAMDYAGGPVGEQGRPLSLRSKVWSQNLMHYSQFPTLRIKTTCAKPFVVHHLRMFTFSRLYCFLTELSCVNDRLLIRGLKKCGD